MALNNTKTQSPQRFPPKLRKKNMIKRSKALIKMEEVNSIEISLRE